MSLWKKFKEEKKNSKNNNNNNNNINISNNNNNNNNNNKLLESISIENNSSLLIRELSLFDNQNQYKEEQERIEYYDVPLIKYYKNCLSELSERYLLNMIYLQENAWKQLKTRRLQCWGGLPNIEQNDLENTLPSWLNEICNVLVKDGFFPPEYPPNHVLINEYQPGQGIMHHTDGPRYLDKVIIISLGSPIVMNFRIRLSSDEIGVNSETSENITQKSSSSSSNNNNNENNQNKLNIILHPRSILYFSDEIYHNYLHGIEAQLFDDYSTLENLLNPPTSTSISISIPQTEILEDEQSDNNVNHKTNNSNTNNHIYYREKRISLTIRHQYRSLNVNS